MSDQQNSPKKQGLVKPYLGFIDTNVLFKKPVSCLFAIVSLLFPVFILSQFIKFELFKSGEVKLIIASILILLIVAFAGIFGAFIWWHRRITRDEGQQWYPNLRRFIQTAGEWFGTVFAISVFGIIVVLMIFLSNEYYYITHALPLAFPGVDITTALFGPIVGFIVIIATKILLFLLDPIIWLIKQIWILFKRFVSYCYRLVIGVSGTVEKNTPIWIGVTWLLAIGVIITSLILCFTYQSLAPIIGLIAALAFMGYLMFKRKHYDV